MVTYRLVHECGCKLQGQETEYRPYLNGGMEVGIIPRCIETGSELRTIERIVT